MDHRSGIHLTGDVFRASGVDTSIPLVYRKIRVSYVMISESFDRRTLANMEIALERACEFLSTARGEA